MRVWEYIWLNKVEPVDKSIDKKEFLKKRDAEKIIKESIRAVSKDIYLCTSGWVQEMPETVYDWWVNHYSQCMINGDDPNHCDKCWNEFFNKAIGGFKPMIIKGGKSNINSRRE